MMKQALGFLASLIVVIIAFGIWAWNSEIAQDWMLEKAVTAQMARPASMDSYEGLKSFCVVLLPQCLPVDGLKPALRCSLENPYIWLMRGLVPHRSPLLAGCR